MNLDVYRHLYVDEVLGNNSELEIA